MHRQGYTYDRGIYYVAISWVTTIIAVAAVSIRLYSRAFLTRSIGSDDFAILISATIAVELSINDSVSVGHGLGRHTALLNDSQISEIKKWDYVNWILVFISYFFLRASVMLFVLRLLPPMKKVAQKIILVAFFFNFAVTMIATVSYGVKCIPFTAVYKDIPNAKCLSERVITSTQYVNAVFACVIDITTALIPQFLLWKVQMRRSTKLILDIIFAFGFVTAGLSIGRAATTNNGIWKEDSTWRVMPSDTFSLVEHHAGIFFASCPAVRQFFAYRKRVGTIYPSDRRQEPNADFVKMRRKINLRDIFWYRQASATKGRVYDALPIFQQSPDTSDMPQTAVSDAEKSPLDVWREKLSNKISKPSPANTQTGGSSSAQSNNGGFLQWLGMRDLRPGFYWRGGGEPLRSIESARRARLEMSANRAHAWPGLGSALAKRDVARKVDDFDLPWERRRESLSNAPHGSTGAAHGANASSETTPPPRDDTESMQILAEPAATRGRVERATPARELYRTRDHGATYERLGSPKAL